jgi:hypothetical protein
MRLCPFTPSWAWKLLSLRLMRILHAFLLSLAACLLVAPPTSAQTADIAFFPADTSNLTPNDTVAVGELLAQAYARVSHKAVLSPTHAQPAMAEAASYEAAASALGVGEYVRLSALALGQRIVITATRYQADGAPIHQSQLTVRSLDEVPEASERLARALFERLPEVPATASAVPAPQLTSHVSPRIDAEVAPAPRARRDPKRQHMYGAKTGVYLPIAKGAKYDPHLGIQFDVRLEMDRFFLEFGVGAIIPTRENVYCDRFYRQHRDDCSGGRRGSLAAFTTELGASYLLSDGDVAPYIGLGLLPRFWIDHPRDDIASMSAYAQLGVMMPRNASMRLFADVRVAQAMISSRLNNGQSVYPTELTLHAGLGW